LYRDRPEPWSEGNTVRPLIHGATYFAELLDGVRALRSGDLLLFTDWRGDPDERLSDDADTEVAEVFCTAAARGVIVRGLLWRSHLDRLRFSSAENRHLGEKINSAGGKCLLDMRVRVGGSHHMKVVVLRHLDDVERDVAYVGGIDLCHSRRDTAEHRGDPQPVAMAPEYGERPPWHDVQVAIRGPAVADVETIFRERWEDPTPLTRNPLHRLGDLIRHDAIKADPLPSPPPVPQVRGALAIQLLRTYPYRRGSGYPFAPDGERTVARGYTKVIRRARRLIYLEDQYLWSTDVAGQFADALREHPELQIIAVVPHFPDQSGRFSTPPNLLGRVQAITALRAAGGDRVAVYGVENHSGTPVYVHAKVCVIDDVWAAVGSDNFNRRSWTHDSEVSCAVLDADRDTREPRDPGSLGDGARKYARDLRLALAREHLDRGDDDDADLVDPATAFAAFREAADELDRWHRMGRRGPRPRGRLRPYRVPELGPVTRVWAEPVYRLAFDPDGRPARLRRQREF
jgi:phosphatidylserine/phosphatidylglycerophosphate/cardiolipin synthase-like enzyme